MKNVAPLILLFLAVGCAKQRNACSLPTFSCLEGKWIEKENTDSSVKEFIQVYMDNNREAFFDGNAYNQLQATQLAIGYYYFATLPGQDSVALAPLWQKQSSPFHRYLKMISDDEIETDYELQPGVPLFKKRYIRE